MINTPKLAAMLLIGLINITAPVAAESSFCSKEASTQRWLSDYRHMLMNALLVQIATRIECGVLEAADMDALHSVHETRGCSRDTPFGEYIHSFVDGENADRLRKIVHPNRHGKSDDLLAICTEIRESELPSNFAWWVEGTAAGNAEASDFEKLKWHWGNFQELFRGVR
ncbi:MAG: hypothetical protein V7695_09595 [Sulfitobacter sp.]